MNTPIRIDYERGIAGNSITVCFDEQQLQTLLAKPSLEIKEQDSLVHALLILAIANTTLTPSSSLKPSNDVKFEKNVNELDKYLPELKSRISHDISKEDFIGLIKQFYREHINNWNLNSDLYMIGKNVEHVMRYTYNDIEKTPSLKRKF